MSLETNLSMCDDIIVNYIGAMLFVHIPNSRIESKSFALKPLYYWEAS